MDDSPAAPTAPRIGWPRIVLFVLVGIATCALAATSVWVLNKQDGGPSQIGMVGVILGAVAVFLPTICFEFFAPFDRAVRFATAGGVFLATCVVLQTGEPTEQALAHLMTMGFAVLAVLSLALWLLVTVRAWLIAMAVIALFFGMFRLEDPTGSMIPRIAWRFSKRHDQLIAQPSTVQSPNVIDLTPTEDDYPQFLGPDRDQIVKRPIVLATDWAKNPPKRRWLKEIGAGWSAFAIVNGYAMTMEQRDTQELVTCYDIKTGDLIWSHGIATRHESALGGIGPRSTPTVVDGKVYALGATGVLRCLDGTTGKLLWKHDLVAERKLTPEQETANIAWGRANSPLVVDQMIVVPMGGRSFKQVPEAEQKSLGLVAPTESNVPQIGDFVSLVAFNKDTGDQIWLGGNSQISYASPTVAVICGLRQIVNLNQDNVAGYDIGTGRQLWQFYWPGESNAAASNSQPHVVSGDRVLISKGYAVGSALYQVRRVGDLWSVDSEPIWSNRTALKTKLANVVIHHDHVYGLSEEVLECVALESGERVWKKGKYGHGQILLVGENLLVISEAGELAIVAADPNGFKELGRIQALEGKTWNNPALYVNLLLVRNAEQAACYELPLEQ